MNVFQLRERFVGDYAGFTRSFINIRDEAEPAERLVQHRGQDWDVAHKRKLLRSSGAEQGDLQLLLRWVVAERVNGSRRNRQAARPHARMRSSSDCEPPR